MNTEKSHQLYQQSLNYFPGGVNSPVRAFGAVEGTPIYFEKGKGCHAWDVDGNKYIDFCCSWGPLILGHSPEPVVKALQEILNLGTSFGAPTKQENELAKLILDNNRFIERIRFVSSGTEATMSAIRLARGYTGRNKLIKFEGCYHGHADHLLVKAGSGLATFGVSSSAGVPEAFAGETIVVPLNDKEAVAEAFQNHQDDIACIILEPLPANNGLLIQDCDFLHFLKRICEQTGALLIFDEVITGFRLGFEGAAGYYNIAPDIVTYGKVIGGGLPVGAYGSSAEIMSQIAPDGPVYQAGTLSGNPMAMAAGLAQLSECLSEGFYENLAEKTHLFTQQLNESFKSNNLSLKAINVGSIFWLSFSEQNDIRAAHEIDPGSMDAFGKFHRNLLNKGVYLGPSGYEVGFVSDAHTENDLSESVLKICDALVQTLN